MTDQGGAPTQLALALSGGGHRASVVSIGALMAVTDRGLGPAVCRISSVSGGSITNAVLAHQGNYGDMSPGEVDQIAGKLVGQIRARHLFHPLGIGLIVFVLPLVVALLVASLGAPGWLTITAGITGALALLLSTGELLRSGINLVHFGARHVPKLGDIAMRPIVHDFCATDLLTGLPIVFSSAQARARRRVPLPYRPGRVAVQHWPCSHLQLAAIVRASAAFPGIAPKVIRFRDGHDRIPVVSLDGRQEPGTKPLRSLTIASDGGVWNNLGTQAIREENDAQQPPIISVNASASPKAARAWHFFVPGAALVAALARIMMILNRNTVEPRVDAIGRDLRRRHADRAAPSPRDPLTVVADMRPLQDTLWEVKRLTSDAPAGQAWGRSAVGTAELERLESSAWWQSVIERDGDSPVTVGTKLTRLTESECFTLLLRGYVNTYLWSLLVKPLTAADLSGIESASLVRRLTGIAGSH